ncbi:hypothetical protein HMPREF1602_02243 [Escherichia coli 907889]|nr:hypothetical protein HMPREF1602_02243 [Escherichia coli 907889]
MQRGKHQDAARLTVREQKEMHTDAGFPPVNADEINRRENGPSVLATVARITTVRA